MPWIHSPVTYCNFDGSYEAQPRLLAAAPHQLLDFTRLRGTNLYCSPEAFAAIRRRLSTVPERGLIFWGSGNYHYAALALLMHIRRPFSLILFDHHTDLQQGSLSDMLSCGSWVRAALRQLPWLKKAMLIGPEPPHGLAGGLEQRVITFPESRLPAPRKLAQLIPTERVHISIDKDLLCRRDATTNWNQGNMPVGRLLEMIRGIMETKQVSGMDVCGEWPVRPHQRFDKQTQNRIRANERSNLAIARLFLKTRHITSQIANQGPVISDRQRIS